jgi:hypothetical protein
MNRIEALKAMIDGGVVVCETGFIIKFENFGFGYYAKDDGVWRSCSLGNMPDKSYKIYTEKREFNIKPFEQVLVRNQDHHSWRATLFSCLKASGSAYPFMCTGENWCQIAPYKNNESKLNTTDDIEGKFTAEDL